MLDPTQFLKQNRKGATLIAWAIFTGATAGAILIALSLLISEVVDRVFLREQTQAAVTNLIIAAVVLILVRATLIFSMELLAQYGASSIKRHLRGQVLQKLNRLGPQYSQREKSGELAHTLVAGIESLNDYFTQYLPAKAQAVLLPILVLIVVFILDPWTALVYIVAGPMLLLLLALIGGQTKAIQQRRFQEMSWMSAYFLDMLQGLPTLKIFGRSHEQGDNIAAISEKYGQTTMDVLRTAFQTSLVLEWSATAATAMVALEVSYRLVNGSMPFNVALAVLLLTPEFFLPLRQYALRYHAGAQAKSIADRLTAILNTPEPKSKFAFNSINQYTGSFEGKSRKIRFDNVSITYAGQRRPALDAVTTTIPEKYTVALVGPTGAGKSTIASLLLRFIEPSRGFIAIDDTPLSSCSPNIWRQQIAWVPQNPHLFYGTISENILLAKPSASHEQLIAAARAANAHDFIKALPQGYDTHVGERALRLSGGQKQRIALARAILKDAPYLIMDESTSQLDKESEALIAAGLRTLMHDRTTLIIAHRLALAQMADLVIVLCNGRVVQTGTHDELLLQKGLYQKLYASFTSQTKDPDLQP